MSGTRIIQADTGRCCQAGPQARLIVFDEILKTAGQDAQDLARGDFHTDPVRIAVSRSVVTYP